MAWTLDGVNIYPLPGGGDTGWMVNPNKTLHTPIGSTTSTIHYVNTPSFRRRINAWVLSEADHSSLRTVTSGSANVSLVDDIGTDTVNVLRMASTRVNNADGSIWYRVTLDLVKQ